MPLTLMRGFAADSHVVPTSTSGLRGGPPSHGVPPSAGASSRQRSTHPVGEGWSGRRSRDRSQRGSPPLLRYMTSGRVRRERDSPPHSPPWRCFSREGCLLREAYRASSDQAVPPLKSMRNGQRATVWWASRGRAPERRTAQLPPV